MSTLGEVEQALGVLAYGYTVPAETGGSRPSRAAFEEAFSSGTAQALLSERVTLLHCTSEYPAPFADVNLRAMDTLAAAFGLPVGYSDHTRGIAVPIAAVARGAAVIEKHFTLDRNLPGPDHKASLEPAELKAMTAAIREVEEALGDSRKFCRNSERGTRDVARKSLVASEGIAKGDPFTAHNLAIKRPGTGRSPFDYWELIGRKAERDYPPETPIE
jgi:N-acetylneuraminate synthase